MKFITEGDLRDLLKKEPFTTYDLIPEVRLTPGARQFLGDRGVKILDKVSASKEITAESKPAIEVRECRNKWKNLQFHSRMKSIEVLFLLTAEDMLPRDVGLAHSVVKLNKQFSSIKKAVKSKGTIENLSCKECTGINETNFSETLDDCFEITEFHMQLDKGKDILLLHRLRCALQEIEPFAQELYLEEKEENYEEINCKVNQLINSLSQLICSVAGGLKCQK
ncbi:cobalamin adenosyltransferase [Neobacillus sp. FSL H8-0543]|uniref:cobalamin adenosyltransferase n=1 Tax=Neobacillus sp. FSL H8-0543 TaxID=2954672 RepID=UPI00315881D7